jgi:threonylcarbamoyladenosine tRNA methylthiotransferase MtaB
MKKVAFHTLGCKVNQYETEAMAQMFKDAGYEIIEFEEKADVYVINTCTVTSFGDKKSRQVIRRCQKNNPQAVVAVVGCYSQVAPQEVAKIQGVDVIAGTAQRNKIVELVQNASKGKRIQSVTDIRRQREYEETGFISYSERVRAFIKIQDGCDNYCTYCIIPYTRGPVRSREPQNIVQEIAGLVQSGFKEFVLTGIHLTSYGKDLKGTGLIDVIESIAKIEGVERIRLGSLEPNKLTEDFINRLKNIKKSCPHFHISLQSGCDSVLKRMNRKYTTREYKEKVELIRKSFEDASITTDIIVGFPGETEDEFKQTLDFLEEISLTKIHVFKYSPRKGTPASIFEGQIGSKVKDERSERLLKLSEQKEKQFAAKFLRKELEVLFEQESTTHPGFIEGHTANFIKIIAKAESSIIGEFGMVRIENIESGYVIGSVGLYAKA